MLKIHNSLTKQKEAFTPITPGEVRMYVCGMTVYDYCHIGHGRIFVVFDMVARYLRYRNYQVTYVRNITDCHQPTMTRHSHQKLNALADHRAFSPKQPTVMLHILTSMSGLNRYQNRCKIMLNI